MANPRRQSNDSTSSLGDIVQSILTEAQFQALRGSGWVLCDGRSVAGSKLATQFGITTVPDARGVFLRGKNNGRADGNEDPGGERSLGNYQADAFQGHWHNIYGQSAQGSNVGFADDIDQFNNNLGAKAREAVSDGTNGAPRTANETRPKNIAVNVFIRIN